MVLNLISSRAKNVSSFGALDIMSETNRLIADGRSIMRMEIGQPEAPTPLHVRSAAELAAQKGQIGYTDAGGMIELRQAICDYYQRCHGLQIPTERIMVTSGSSAAFNIVFLASFDHGDCVALAAPGYPAYRNILKGIGVDVVDIQVDETTGWCLTGDHIREAHLEKQLAGVLVASPANPTGVISGQNIMKDICETCDELGLRFVSDEIYHGLSYGLQTISALAFGNEAIVINSFSKYFCMTGWRIGWMVLPENLIDPCVRLAQSFYISPPAISQLAALAAFDATDELEEIKAGYGANRAYLLEHLPKIGFDEILPSDGAFYLYVGVSRWCDDSKEFSYRLLYEAGVAVGPGIDFDPVRGHQYIRLSFAGSKETIVESVERLGRFLSVIEN